MLHGWYSCWRYFSLYIPLGYVPLIHVGIFLSGIVLWECTPVHSSWVYFSEVPPLMRAGRRRRRFLRFLGFPLEGSPEATLPPLRPGVKGCKREERRDTAHKTQPSIQSGERPRSVRYVIRGLLI